ncbi:RNA-binding protein Musashi homolog 2-like [Montipora foliosa]|uniref:RNA-binding protein Musashi homolog 2-like n=1 Tax=Montipora foliosa TaxID=591990 RepID=UPI0035F173E5
MVKGGTHGDDIGKIFVGGLSHETNEESLKNHFSRFGEVTDVVVMRDPSNKRPRGFGFVTFRDPNSVNDVVNSNKPHVVDKKTVDPKPAVPRGPTQAGTIAQLQQERDNNALKIFVGGIAKGTTEDDLRNYFQAYGKVTHVHLMYENTQMDGTKRMRGFGFVTFESSQPVEKTANIHYHQINGKTVEVKRAEKREPKPKNAMEGIPGMSAYQHLGGHPGYGVGQFPQQGAYGMQHQIGMGRGFPGYGAMAGGGPGAASYGGGGPGLAPGFGYGGAAGAAGVPVTPYAGDPSAGPVASAAMYGRGAPTPGYGAGFPAGVSGAQQPPMAAGGGSAAGPPAGYPEYNRMPGSQAGPPGPAPGPPNIESAGPSDYSGFGLGNYPQQELQYGPQRGQFPTDSNYGSYGGNDPSGYTGGGPGYGGEGPSFGRGSSATRGFHPYGR